MINIKEDGKYRKELNRLKVEKLSLGIIKYNSDIDKIVRKDAGLCKYCYYLHKGIGVDELTFQACESCGVDIVSENTCADKLCLGCARHLERCKGCGQELD